MTANDDDLPLALRRTRRSSTNLRKQDIKKDPDVAPQPPLPEVKTPRNKRVRFSAPGTSSSGAETGLTPMIDRAIICDTPSSSRSRSIAVTPSRRRHVSDPVSLKATTGSSTTAQSAGDSSSLRRHVSVTAAQREAYRRRTTSTLRRSAGDTSSLHRNISDPTSLRAAAHKRRTSSTTAQPAGDDSSLHHTVDGRVERRIRRSAQRSYVQKLEAAHQRSEQQARSEITRLRTELRIRDREIYEMQNATIIVPDIDRVNDLEQEIEALQAKLRDAERREERERSVSSTRTSVVDWTLAARDPFEELEESLMDARAVDDDGDEDMFGDTTMAQFTCSTPTRVRNSPSGPETSFPSPPATSPLLPPKTMPSRRAVTPKNASAGVQAELPDLEKKIQIDSLQREMGRLTSSLDTYKSLIDRLEERVPHVPNEEDSTLEPRINNVLHTLSDRTAALTQLTSSISSLGFLGTDAAEMITSIASAFRTARLELEYLTPGEITLPLTASGPDVLDLLLVRLRELSKKAKEGDEAVDEYHAIELNLRQQLHARILAMDDMRAELEKKNDQLEERSGQVDSLQVGNERFKCAMATYDRDIRELERLVEKMESEAANKDATIGKKDTTIGEKDTRMADLEERLAAATRRESDLQDELEVAQASRKKHLAAVNKRSGEALALRDARVVELRDEIDRINAALRNAYQTICGLRAGEQRLEAENGGLRAEIDKMRTEMAEAEKLKKEKRESDDEQEGQAGRYLSGGLARRVSGRKRRRPDSGLGFLDEEEIDA